MSLIQFLRILAARRGIVLAALLSCFLVALIMSQILPKRYEATARVMIDTTTPDPVTGVSIGSGYRAFIKTQTELIEDEQNAGRVVDKLGWANEPELIKAYARATDGKGTEIRRWLAQQIIEVTSAQVIEPSNIIEIKYTSATPDIARRIATMIREVYIEGTVDLRRETAGRNADWYSEQAEKAKLILTSAESDRAKFAKEKGIAIQGGAILDVETAKLSTLTDQSASAATALQTGPAPTVTPPGGATLQLAAINQQIAQAAETLGPNNPNYQALQRQKTVVEGELAREKAAIAAYRSGPSTSAAVAQIDAAYNAQKNRVIGQSETLSKLEQMNRDIAVKRDQYLSASQRAAQLKLEASTSETTIMPLGEATVPDKPSSPKVPLIIFGAIGFGLALGVGLALLIELFGRRVRCDEDLEYAAKAPVFAVIGQPDNHDSWYRRFARALRERISDRRQRQLAEAST
jgi:polysaccharide biosynthesis transport protein